MTSSLGGVWTQFAAFMGPYSAFFPSHDNIVGHTLSDDRTSFLVTNSNGASVEYLGASLAFDGTTLTGRITGLVLRDAGAAIVATMSDAPGNRLLIEDGVDIGGGAALVALLFSGDNLLIGSGLGGPGAAREVLAGGAGRDTYRIGGGNTVIDDGVGRSTLDLSALTAPAEVNLASQSFTTGGATGQMSGVTDVIGGDGADTVYGGAGATFTIATGDGDDYIRAYDANLTELFAGPFVVDAGAGDDTVDVNQFGHGLLDGGAGDDALRGSGDLRFYDFRGFETLANAGALILRTAQLRSVKTIDNLNPFNGGQVTIQLHGDGTVDFDRRMAPGLTVNAQAFTAGTNLIGTDGADVFTDFSTGLVDGFPVPSTFLGGGGDDRFDNNGGAGVWVLTGKMSDYAIERVPSLAVIWRITDLRDGSPDGTDTLQGVFETARALRFADYTASIAEHAAYIADNTALPAVIRNGKLELFGPDNFDYAGMFPTLDRATAASLAADGASYAVTYANGVRVTWRGEGLTLDAPYTPDGGIVTEITVEDVTAPGGAVLLARFSSDAASGNLMRVPFEPLLLAGGERVYLWLMDGNNRVVGSPNDDVIVADVGANTFEDVPGESFNTLLLGRKVDSYTVTPTALGDGIERVDYVDGYDSYEGLPLIPPDFGGTAAAALNAATATFDDTAASGGQIQPITSPIIKFLIGLAGGDPHITTFDGVGYSFHALGEFVLARSAVAGDPFEVQIRAVPFVGSATVVGQAAARAGNDRVTFDITRPDPVRVNGLAADFAGGPLQLDGGVLSETAPGNWALVFDTGETLSVGARSGGYVDVSLNPGGQRAPGTLQGILGDFDGDRADEFQLPDGTVLQRPIGQPTLYGLFADAWRVTDATSLMDYGAGEATGSFTRAVAPPAFGLDDVPAEIRDRAEALVSAAGIVDPALRDFAVYDYLLTGDPGAIAAIAALNQSGVGVAEAEPQPSGPAPSMIGIIADPAELRETADGATAVTLRVWRTGSLLGDVAVDWAVTAPATGYLGAEAFGGALPLGQVTIAQGETSATITVTVPADVFDTPTASLRVEISSPAGLPVLNAGAEVRLVNDDAVEGTAAEAVFVKLDGPGALSGNGDDWTLDLGTLELGAEAPRIVLGLRNSADLAGNALSGLFAPTTGSAAVSFDGTGPVLRLAPGAVRGGLVAEIDTATAGAFETVLTLDATQSNATGFMAALGAETLTVRGRVVDPNPATVRFATADAGSAPEDGGRLIFTLLREGNASVSFTASLRLSGSAHATDVLGISGATPDPQDASLLRVTFAAGQIEAAIEVIVDNDAEDEPDETVILTLEAVEDGVLSPSGPLAATGAILDDDLPPPVFALALTGNTAAEGGSIDFAVARVSGGPGAATLTYTVGPGATDPAAADDLVVGFGSFSIVIPEGEDVVAFSLQSTPDTVFEADETVSVALVSSTLGTVDTAPVTALILNDDARPNRAPTDIGLTGMSVAENLPSGTLVGRLSAVDPDGDTAFVFTVAPGGDPSGGFRVEGDRLLTTRPFDFEAGAVASVTVRVVDGGGAGHDETFAIAIEDVAEPPPGHVIVGKPNARRLEGGDGDDVLLIGASRATQVLGGDGADVFVFGRTAANRFRDVAHIRDFEQGLDLIDLSGAAFSLRLLGGNSVITLATPDRDTLNVIGVSLTAADFTDDWTNGSLLS